MGEFEDLIAQAKAGDSTALDSLEEKYSGSALRKKAEEAAEAQKRYETGLPYIRQAKFAELLDQMPSDIEVELTLEDLGEVPPEDITLDLLKSKASAKQEQLTEFNRQAAKQAGFETVEEYQAALQTAKQAQEEKTKAMTAVGSAASSGGGAPPKEESTEPHEAMFAGYEAAIKAGQTKDYAMGEGLHDLLTAQAPVEE